MLIDWYIIYIDVFLSDNGLWCSARRKHEDPSSPQALKPSLSTCETLQPLGSQSRVSVQVGCSWSPRPGPSLSLLMRYVRYVHSSEFRFLRIYLSPCRLPMQHLMQYSIESQRCTVLKWIYHCCVLECLEWRYFEQPHTRWKVHPPVASWFVNPIDYSHYSHIHPQTLVNLKLTKLYVNFTYFTI